MKDSTIKKRIRALMQEDPSVERLLAATIRDCSGNSLAARAEKAKDLIIEVMNEKRSLKSLLKKAVGA